ncbi:MAG: RNA polymerase sigma factor [Actinomycetota bacterium]
MIAEREPALQAEDAGTMEALYRRHAPDARRLAFLITGDQALAQDLAHDAFVRVAGRLHDLRDPEAFGAYLDRTVTNLAISHFRRRKVERAHGWVDPATLSTPGHAAQIDAREALRVALCRLSPRQRSAIVLRFYLDTPDREVARILRCRPGTVRSLISRGLAELRQEVDHE